MTAQQKALETKLRERVHRIAPRADDSYGMQRLADAVLVDKKTQSNGCLSAFVASALLVLLAALGARHIDDADTQAIDYVNSIAESWFKKQPAKPRCICLEYIHDNGDCPVHGKSPYKGGQS